MTIKSYAMAINEAHEQLLASDDRVFVIGQGVESPWCVGTTTLGLEGSDVTIVAVSYLVREAMEAADVLSSGGISAEVIDPRTLKPLDIDLIMSSVKKTGRLVVADPDWPCCSFSEHVAYLVATKLFNILKSPIERVTFPDTPVPASTPLERAYFPKCDDIIEAVKRTLEEVKV